MQALTLLNDPTFVEAARVFAARIMAEGGATPEQRINWAYRTAVSRAPSSEIAAELKRVYGLHLSHYKQTPEEAKKLIAVGNAQTPVPKNVAEAAAWTSVARVLLNLHETITRY